MCLFSQDISGPLVCMSSSKDSSANGPQLDYIFLKNCRSGLLAAFLVRSNYLCIQWYGQIWLHRYGGRHKPYLYVRFTGHVFACDNCAWRILYLKFVKHSPVSTLGTMVLEPSSVVSCCVLVWPIYCINHEHAYSLIQLTISTNAMKNSRGVCKTDTG